MGLQKPLFLCSFPLLIVFSQIAQYLQLSSGAVNLSYISVCLYFIKNLRHTLLFVTFLSSHVSNVNIVLFFLSYTSGIRIYVTYDWVPNSCTHLPPCRSSLSTNSFLQQSMCNLGGSIYCNK